MSTFWEGKLKEYVKEYYSNPYNFLRQRTIGFTTHTNQQEIAQSYFECLMKDIFFKDNILPYIYEGTLGRPHIFKPFPQCSPLTIFQLYYLKLIRDHLNIFVPTHVTNFVEVGGGYGNFRRMMKNLNYIGKYTIIDFPEMLEIQNDYLQRSQIKETSFQTIDDFLTQRIESEESILFATFSVNEMSLEDRKKLEIVYHKFKYLFFAYNFSFDNINNQEYFNKLKNNLSEIFQIQIIPDEFRIAHHAWFMLCSKGK